MGVCGGGLCGTLSSLCPSLVSVCTGLSDLDLLWVLAWDGVVCVLDLVLWSVPVGGSSLVEG